MSDTLTKPSIKRRSGHAGTKPLGDAAFKQSGQGVVNALMRGSKSETASSTLTTSQLVNLMQTGLPVRELIDLRKNLAMPMSELVPLLGISKATLNRRLAGKRLKPAESGLVVRFARLMGKAVEVMESAENARLWLTSPQFGLGGAVPLDFAKTELGAREVEELLERIEGGVYS